MKQLISCMIIFLMIIGLTGCGWTKSNGSKSSTPKPQPPKQITETNPKKEPGQVIPGKVQALRPADFFPLATGFIWKYQGEGNEYATFKRIVYTTKGNLAQIREDNGGTISASVFKTTSDAVTRIFFRGEVYKYKSFLSEKPNENTIILKSPLEVGTKWKDQNGTKEIVGLNTSVFTPAGLYSNCLELKISNENSTVYEYYKKGVGMVKREFVSGETKITSSLQRFSSPK